MTTPTFDPADPAGVQALCHAKTVEQAVPILAAQYRLLVDDDQVVELRALKVQRNKERPHTEAGYFDAQHLVEMATAALEVTNVARGVYFTLNPIHPDLLARRANRIGWAQEGELSKAKDVLRRRWLLVDADAVRDPHISANDAEKLRASDTILAVRDYLRAKAWPEPILTDSGNGYHQLYRVDFPAADSGLVERLLKSLAARFDTEHVKIDQSVCNPARICKLPGTKARKGDDTKTRPHRRARILEVPYS